MAYSVKVYIVQRADRDGNLRSETPIAVKLTYAEARKVAMMKSVAPAKITMLVADKSEEPNGEGQIGHYSVCQDEANAAKAKHFDDLDSRVEYLAASRGRK